MSAPNSLINKEFTRNPFNLKDLARFTPKSLIPKDRFPGGFHPEARPTEKDEALQHSSFDDLQQPRNAFAKVCRFGDQAQHQMSFAGKIVEVSRMHDDSHLAQEIDG